MKKLITLTPIDKFYFGGDTTFKIEGEDNNRRFTSYIVQSGMFPQQTSLLGMFRYLLLSHDQEAFDAEKKEIKDTKKAKELIGEFGFKVDKKNHFGKIDSLSFCFLQKQEGNDEWKALLPAPLDYGYTTLFHTEKENKAFINGEEKIIPCIKSYNPKEKKETVYITNDLEEVKQSEIFCEDSRTGISRDSKTGQAEDGMFYKQINYRFGKKRKKEKEKKDEKYIKYRFAFYADLDESVEIDNYNGEIVSIGGDNSQFVLGIENSMEECVEYSSLYKNKSKFDSKLKIVLLSDTYIENISYSFSISETIPFRFLVTDINKKHYNILEKEIDRSDRYELYKRGSVFFFENEVDCFAFKKQLEEQSAGNFAKIGYNAYQEFKN